MNRLAIRALRILIVIGFIGSLGMQLWFLPTLAAEIATVGAPELAYLRYPYLVISIAAIACVQVAAVAVWQLLGMVARDAIFDRGAFRWVDTVIWCAIAATALMLGLFVYHGFVLQLGPPAFGLLLLALIVAGAGIALLMAVMRSLLVKAAGMQAELAEVI